MGDAPIINGDAQFAELLNTIMDQQRITAAQLAARLDVSGASVGRWLKGHQPREYLRRQMVAKLQAPIAQAEHVDVPALPPIESKAPMVSVIIDDGMNMKLDMKVPEAVARKVIALLFGHA